MNGRWGDGAPVGASVPAPVPQRRPVCDEARAAAAWLWVQSEVAGVFERFSRDLQAIHSRGLNAAAALEKDAAGIPGSKGALHDPSGSGGARDALNSLLLLCSEAGAEANRFSASLRAGVLKPLEEALQPLARAWDASNPPSAATHLQTEFKAGGEVQKAARRLQLAEEELTVRRKCGRYCPETFVLASNAVGMLLIVVHHINCVISGCWFVAKQTNLSVFRLCS